MYLDYHDDYDDNEVENDDFEEDHVFKEVSFDGTILTTMMKMKQTLMIRKYLDYLDPDHHDDHDHPDDHSEVFVIAVSAGGSVKFLPAV